MLSIRPHPRCESLCLVGVLSCWFRIWGKPLGACAPRGFLYVWCGGVLLSHTLSGAVPSPCQALASGFGMGPGVSPGPWPPQIFSYTVRRWGLPACGGLGTGQRTRICRCFVLWPDNAHCRLVSFAGGRCGPNRWLGLLCCLSSVSTGRLHPSRGFHVRPIDHVFCMGTTGTRRFHGMLILEQASRLDAFSGYPFRT